MTPELNGLTALARAALEGPCAVPADTPIWAACSGGADSVALVHVLAANADRWPLGGVVFVDHGLRDVSSEREAAERAADDHGAPFVALEVSVAPGGNLQARARAARYEAIEAAVPAGAVIATGHTATDQAETLLGRLVRGAGIRGLAGIRARQGRLVRPLLDVRREQTRGLGLPFADDPTNASDRYLRNRIRRDVLPLLRELNPRIEAALASLAEAARVELELADAVAERARDADLSGTSPELAEVALRWRIHADLPEVPPPSRAAARALAERLVSGRGAASFSLGGGLRGVARRGSLELEADEDPRSEVAVPGPGTYRLGQLKLVVEEVTGPRDIASHEAAPAGAFEAWLDPATVAWPMTLRPERPGDRQAAGREADRELVPWTGGGPFGGRPRALVDGQGRVVLIARDRGTISGMFHANPGTADALRIRLIGSSGRDT